LLHHSPLISQSLTISDDIIRVTVARQMMAHWSSNDWYDRQQLHSIGMIDMTRGEYITTRLGWCIDHNDWYGIYTIIHDHIPIHHAHMTSLATVAIDTLPDGTCMNPILSMVVTRCSSLLRYASTATCNWVLDNLARRGIITDCDALSSSSSSLSANMVGAIDFHRVLWRLSRVNMLLRPFSCTEMDATTNNTPSVSITSSNDTDTKRSTTVHSSSYVEHCRTRVGLICYPYILQRSQQYE
jgi:hypothetical protein